MPYQNFTPTVVAPPWDWNPASALQQSFNNALAQGKAFGDLELKSQLVPSEIAKNQASADNSRAAAEYYRSKADNLGDTPILQNWDAPANTLDKISPELMKGMFGDSAPETIGSKTSSAEPGDAEMDRKAAESKNPEPPATDSGKTSSVTAKDLLHLGVDPSNPLGQIITNPEAESSSDTALASIAKTLPMTPESIAANGSKVLLADNTGPGAISDTRPTMAQQAAVAAESAPVQNFGANPLNDFASGTGKASEELGANQILSGTKGINKYDPKEVAKSAAEAPKAPEFTVGSRIAAYDQAISNETLQQVMAKQEAIRYTGMARALSPKDPNRMALIQKANQALMTADTHTNNMQLLQLKMSQATGLPVQNMEMLRSIKDPTKINAIHSYVDSGKAPDYGSALQLYTTERTAAANMADPAKKEAMVQKLIQSIDSVSKIKNSGNVDGNTWVSLDAQEKTLTQQLNSLTGVQSAPVQYRDPLDQFGEINTKLSGLSAAGVKATDLDLGGGVKLTGVPTDPNKASAIIRPQMMKFAADNNALYNIQNIKDESAVSEVNRFIQDYSKAPAGKNYIVTGLPGIIKKDPTISAQQVLAAHFNAFSPAGRKPVPQSESKPKVSTLGAEGVINAASKAGGWAQDLINSSNKEISTPPPAMMEGQE